MRKKKVAELDIMRRVTTFLHCEGTTVSGWTSCAAALKRCQVHDHRQFGRRSWADYPMNRFGWITDTGRCIGVGEIPRKNVLTKAEVLIAVPLPFEGSGITLREHAEEFVQKMNRALRKAARKATV